MPGRSQQTRSAFIEFFTRRGHTSVASSPLVPIGDPTLLFINAGMNQFKDVFTGREQRPYKRATTAQKCVRAGGKHNDLENVGRTARHHTFFEMLGNFSFGDYFKEEAITFAWDLLTKDLALPRDRLAVTVFGGDADYKLGPDDEARTLWRKIAGVPEERIMGLGVADNFWQMGDTGPCGPCSEIHVHQGDDIPCAEERAGGRCAGPACACDRWLEIWNLVFMQFERSQSGTLTSLPAPSVDTGMGLERLLAVLEGKRSNYETDLFRPLIAAAEALSKTHFVPSDYEGPSVSLRAIADHARAAAFLIADGVMPEKTGREYVLRRIMRRAIYQGWLLGIKDLFLHQVSLQVVDEMKSVYPELGERRATISEIVRLEESRFRETLERGVTLLEGFFESDAKSGRTKQVSGELSFRLYDTFGFPFDLTEVIAERKGFAVDSAGFDREMEKQRSRSSFAGSGEEKADAVLLSLSGRMGATKFLGYDTMSADAKVLAVLATGERVEERKEAGPSDGEIAIVVDQTPFYAEQGGQVGDTGIATATGAQKAGLRLEIFDTQRTGELYVHKARVKEGMVAVGQALHLDVDLARRDAIRRNHSATHLVHHALRHVLGAHVSQKGSVVMPDRLRFDFSHSKPMTEEERKTVEALVNAAVLANAPVGTDVLGTEAARKTGAIAFFGEKYGETVRVVAMGDSKEFCGGTHVRQTGDIGLFKIVEESGIAQGVRRIVAITGTTSLAHMQGLEANLQQVAAELKVPPSELVTRAAKLSQEVKELRKQVSDLEQRLAAGGSGGGKSLLDGAVEIAGAKVLATRTDLVDPKQLRELGDRMRDHLKSGVVVLFGTKESAVTLLVMVTKDLLERVQAGKLVGVLAPLIGGRGGGRPDLAQAGGQNPAGIDAGLVKAKELIAAALA